MHITIFSIILLSILILVINLANIDFIKKSYYRGIKIWMQWLPVISAVGFLLIIGTNLIDINYFYLHKYFNHYELLVLLIISPLLFTKYANIIAGIVSIYLLEKIIFSGFSIGNNLTVSLVLSSLLIISIIGDKMPWLTTNHIPSFSTISRIREIILLIISLIALGILFYTFVNLRQFSRWWIRAFHFYISSKFLVIIIFSLFLAWISVALDMARQIIFPIIILPSLIIASFVTALPYYFLLIPLVICSALFLSIADRRLIIYRK